MIQIPSTQVLIPSPGNCCHIVSLSATWLVAIATFFFLIAPATTIGLFSRNVLNLNLLGEESTYISLPDWAYFGWAFLFTYQLIALFYGLSTILRRSINGTPLYMVATVIPTVTYCMWFCFMALVIVWIFLLDFRQYVAALVMLYLIVVALVAITATAAHSICSAYPTLYSQGFVQEDRLYVGLFLNPMTVVLAGMLIFSNLLLAIILQTNVGLSPDLASGIPFVVLMLQFFIYALMDLGVFQRYMRFLYAPFLIYLITAISLATTDLSEKVSLSPFIIGHVVIVSIVLLCKICLDMYREATEPRFGIARLQREGIATTQPNMVMVGGNGMVVTKVA